MKIYKFHRLHLFLDCIKHSKHKKKVRGKNLFIYSKCTQVVLVQGQSAPRSPGPWPFSRTAGVTFDPMLEQPPWCLGMNALWVSYEGKGQLHREAGELF